MNLAMLLFSVSFFGMLLSNVIFLQQVWGYSVLRAALAGAPGPLLVAFLSRPTSGLAARIGFRPVLLLGGVTWMAGSVLLAVGAGASPHWATHWLPAVLLTGAGIGLTLPVQAGVAVASLPDHRSGTGSAVSQSFRPLGAVLGISLFVAVVGDSGPAQAVGAFPHVWWVFGAVGLVSVLIVCLPVQARGTGGPEPVGAVGAAAGPLALNCSEPPPAPRRPCLAVLLPPVQAAEIRAGGRSLLSPATRPDPVLPPPLEQRVHAYLVSAVHEGTLSDPWSAALEPWASPSRPWQGAEAAQRPSVRRTQLVRASREATPMAVSAATSS